jgi:predicted nucleotidyltransferase
MVKKIAKRSATKKKKAAIAETIASFLDQHQEIYCVYIHGSFLTADLFADIDIGLLLARPPENLIEYEFEIEIAIERQVNLPVDVRVLNNAPLSFIQNVIRHGKVVLDKKPNTRSDFESYSLRKYFDFAPFRRRYLSEVINAPI